MSVGLRLSDAAKAAVLVDDGDGGAGDAGARGVQNQPGKTGIALREKRCAARHASDQDSQQRAAVHEDACSMLIPAP